MPTPRVRVNMAELAPTQASIGGFEVMLKTDRFKLMSPTAIDDYLRDKEAKGKPVLVVKGLHRFFIVDGHHTLSAILTACQPRELDLALRADFSDLTSEADFWDRMEADGLAYQRRLGVDVSPSSFPSTLHQLIDDPFRSVAWLIRKMGAFQDIKQPYQEFFIADFLRVRMAFTPASYHEYETACLRGFELMRSLDAKKWAKAHGLPGFKSVGNVPGDLVDRYYNVITAARRPGRVRGR